ncbi:MAG: ABC transporter permease [Prevotella sp.]|nr:ABC transporter permease [Prevotella sp.]
MTIFGKILKWVADICRVWAGEMRAIFKDEGVLIFFFLVPLAYPLLYSWIYNNEVVRETPVAVVDMSHSSDSRDLIRRCDATPDVCVTHYSNSLAEAEKLMSDQQIKGIIVIPEGFAVNRWRMQQSVVSVYCDMAIMLNYKNVFAAVSSVVQQINSEIQIQWSNHITEKEKDMSVQPIIIDDVAMYNPSSGYGSFVLPAVLILIIQQTMLLGIGMLAGTRRERGQTNKSFICLKSTGWRQELSTAATLLMGRGMSYLLIYIVMASYLTIIIPHIYDFITIGRWEVLVSMMVPYLLACVCFGVAVSQLFSHREDVMLVVVFFSLPLLFISGISWPQSAMPAFWEYVASLFPSTFAIRAFVKTSSMSANMGEISSELIALWIQVAVYFMLAIVAIIIADRRAKAQNNNN